MSARNTHAAKAARRAARASADERAIRTELADYGAAILTGTVRLSGTSDETTTHASAALWVSEHGRLFAPGGARPAGMARGEPLECFANAQREGREHDLGYAEGFAGPSEAGRWILHAWNTDGAGRVIDPTWDDDPLARCQYFGVPVAAGDLPPGEKAGSSVIGELLVGKLLDWDRVTGRVRLIDGTDPIARAILERGEPLLFSGPAAR